MNVFFNQSFIASSISLSSFGQRLNDTLEVTATTHSHNWRQQFEQDLTQLVSKQFGGFVCEANGG